MLDDDDDGDDSLVAVEAVAAVEADKVEASNVPVVERVSEDISNERDGYGLKVGCDKEGRKNLVVSLRTCRVSLCQGGRNENGDVCKVNMKVAPHPNLAPRGVSKVVAHKQFFESTLRGAEGASRRQGHLYRTLLLTPIVARHDTLVCRL